MPEGPGPTGTRSHWYTRKQILEGTVKTLDDSYEPLISVIVPIYNVEEYVWKCLDSLKNQTMKQIEVIMVDDGSTDKSREIAEEYVAKPGVWPDFRLIKHDVNRGLSAARNSGIDIAKADWIMFVDSDDWVEPEFCMIPYKSAIEYNADLIVFPAEKKKDIPYGIVDSETAVRLGDSYAWNKLYWRNLFDNIRYPEGRVYEDLAITHKLIFTAKQIVMIPDVLCHHIYRKDSISQICSATNKREGFISAQQRAEDLNSYGYKEATYMPTLVSYALGLLTRAYPSDDPIYKKAEDIVNMVDDIPSELSIKKRIMLKIWKRNKKVFHLVCKTFRQKDNSIIP